MPCEDCNEPLKKGWHHCIWCGESFCAGCHSYHVDEDCNMNPEPENEIIIE